MLANKDAKKPEYFLHKASFIIYLLGCITIPVFTFWAKFRLRHKPSFFRRAQIFFSLLQSCLFSLKTLHILQIFSSRMRIYLQLPISCHILSLLPIFHSLTL